MRPRSGLGTAKPRLLTANTCVRLFAVRESPSKVVGPKSGVLRDAREHAWANLLAVVKRKNLVAPTLARQNAVRARLTLGSPSEAIERPQHCAPLLPPSRLSSGKQFSRFLRKRLAVVNSIRDNAQRQRSDVGSRLCLGLAIRENAGKSRNLGNPSPILFALEFDLEHATPLLSPTGQ
jgi:hypothetical protein